jgi:hypothetical protein
MKPWLVLVAMVACACPSKQSAGPAAGSGSAHTGSGSAAPTDVTATTCDGVRARVEQLYRAEAQVKEPKRVEDAVADNTAMVMKDCAKDPTKVVPCLAKAATVADVEKQCLVPLDDEGTEGAH